MVAKSEGGSFNSMEAGGGPEMLYSAEMRSLREVLTNTFGIKLDSPVVQRRFEWFQRQDNQNRLQQVLEDALEILEQEGVEDSKPITVVVHRLAKYLRGDDEQLMPLLRLLDVMTAPAVETAAASTIGMRQLYAALRKVGISDAFIAEYDLEHEFPGITQALTIIDQSRHHSADYTGKRVREPLRMFNNLVDVVGNCLSDFDSNNRADVRNFVETINFDKVEGFSIQDSRFLKKITNAAKMVGLFFAGGFVAAAPVPATAAPSDGGAATFTQTMAGGVDLVRPTDRVVFRDEDGEFNDLEGGGDPEKERLLGSIPIREGNLNEAVQTRDALRTRIAEIEDYSSKQSSGTDLRSLVQRVADLRDDINYMDKVIKKFQAQNLETIDDVTAEGQLAKNQTQQQKRAGVAAGADIRNQSKKDLRQDLAKSQILADQGAANVDLAAQSAIEQNMDELISQITNSNLYTPAQKAAVLALHKEYSAGDIGLGTFQRRLAKIDSRMQLPAYSSSAMYAPGSSYQYTPYSPDGGYNVYNPRVNRTVTRDTVFSTHTDSTTTFVAGKPVVDESFQIREIDRDLIPLGNDEVIEKPENQDMSFGRKYYGAGFKYEYATAANGNHEHFAGYLAKLVQEGINPYATKAIWRTIVGQMPYLDPVLQEQLVGMDYDSGGEDYVKRMFSGSDERLILQKMAAHGLKLARENAASKYTSTQISRGGEITQFSRPGDTRHVVLIAVEPYDAPNPTDKLGTANENRQVALHVSCSGQPGVVALLKQIHVFFTKSSKQVDKELTRVHTKEKEVITIKITEQIFNTIVQQTPPQFIIQDNPRAIAAVRLQVGFQGRIAVRRGKTIVFAEPEVIQRAHLKQGQGNNAGQIPIRQGSGGLGNNQAPYPQGGGGGLGNNQAPFPGGGQSGQGNSGSNGGDLRAGKGN